MSAGTVIIKEALADLGVISVLQPENPDSIALGQTVLNAMIAEWQDEGIDMGCVPLKSPGSELSEPLGAKNAIRYNLSVALSSSFPGSNLSDELRRQAKIGFEKIARLWRKEEVPKREVRGTLPIGSGNKTYRGRNYFTEGSELA